MKCSFCNEKAIYFNGSEYFCRKHFIEYFEEKVLKTIEEYKLIKPGERIAVAVSGGKDSTSLLYFLWKYKKDLDIEIIGIHIDEGIEGYRPILTDFLLKIAKKYNWEIHIYRFKDIFGITLDEAVKKTYLKPCTICGVWRRWIMNRAAKELSCNKIATAHNLNDEAQTIIMNLLESNFKDFLKGGPYVGIKEFSGFVPRIKPFYFIKEKETTIYALLNNINPPWTECKYIYGMTRDIVRSLLYKLESKYNICEKLVKNYLKILERIKDKEKIKFELKPCKICGELTSRDICRACEIRKILNLL